MNVSGRRRTGWPTIAGVIILLITFYFSKIFMAESRIVETVLAGGGDGLSPRLIAVGFILLRFFVLFVLPGFLTSWVALLVMGCDRITN